MSILFLVLPKSASLKLVVKLPAKQFHLENGCQSTESALLYKCNLPAQGNFDSGCLASLAKLMVPFQVGLEPDDIYQVLHQCVVHHWLGLYSGPITCRSL